LLTPSRVEVGADMILISGVASFIGIPGGKITLTNTPNPMNNTNMMPIEINPDNALLIVAS
jgi:hypothetical protein